MANNATKFGTVALGSGIAGAIIALVTANSLVTRGNIVLDSTDVRTSKVQVVTNGALVNYQSFSGSNVNTYVTASSATLKVGGGLFSVDATGTPRAVTSNAKTFSGGTVKAGGGLITAGPTGLLVAPSLSGALTQTVAAAGKSQTDALRIACIKGTGLIGYAVRTSTGFVQSVCN